MAGTIAALERTALERTARASPGVDAGPGCEVGSSPRSAAHASVREVCLIGVAARPESWAVGAPLPWWGRVYRVETTQDTLAGPGYVHLAPWGEEVRATPRA
jgi:hypothetical protein